jgi:hypothetical protein
MQTRTQTRRILSYTLFILGVIVFLALGLGAGRWVSAVGLGLVFELAGVIFYRRGK